MTPSTSARTSPVALACAVLLAGCAPGPAGGRPLAPLAPGAAETRDVEPRGARPDLDAAASLPDIHEREMNRVRAELADARRLARALEVELLDVRGQLEALRQRSPMDDGGWSSPLLPPVPERIHARVVDVAAADVVLSAGSDDRVERGITLTVHRGGRLLAKIVVEQVRRDDCAGRLLYLCDGETIRRGDEAATRLQ